MVTNDQIILNQILQERKQEVAPSISDTDYFELFTAEQILKEYDLSYDEIQSGIVDGGGDGGIDALYLFINGEIISEDTELPTPREVFIELHVVQAKSSAGFSEVAVQKLRSSMEELLDLSKPLSDFSSAYNEKVLAIMEKVRDANTRFASRFPKFRISFYYASKGDSPHPNTERQVTTLKSSISRLFSAADFSFDFLGARGLLDLARKTPTTTYNLSLAENPISTGNVSFICLVNLQEFYKFLTDDHGRMIKSLFESNVRDYQGSVQVNQAIQGTLQQPQGEDFWWLNNGITMIATKATLSGKTLTIEAPQIVNGLQTSSELYKHMILKSNVDDKRNILIRVIVPNEIVSRDRIIKATNSQTSIPQASLRATDPIHQDIEDYLKSYGFYYDRRKNYYKNEGRPINKIISIPYLAQSVMSIVLKKPDDARARPSSLMKEEEDYNNIFNSNYPIQLYLQCIRIMKRVEEFLRSTTITFSGGINNMKFHVAMFATLLLLNTSEVKPDKLVSLPLDRFDDDLLGQCLQEVATIYQQMGDNDQVAKGPDFVQKLVERLSQMTYHGRLTA